jgi:DNA-binding winged helix-turn-helix (wHTH) protein
MAIGNWARRWKLALVPVGVLTLSGLVVWWVAARDGGEELAAFQERGEAYAAAFAESAATWIQEGNLEMLHTAARFMLLGSTLFVQVYWEGELVVDEQVGEFPLPPDLVEETTLVSLPSGERYLYICFPFPQEGPRGWLRVGLDASWLAVARRGRLLVGAGTALGADLVALTLWAFFLRRRRRRGRQEAPTCKVGALEVFEEAKQVLLFGQPVRLSPKQFALLRLLASAPGKVFSDREILKAVWPDSRYANSKDVKQYVYLVRQRLGKVRPGAEGMIVTVPGFGYKLIPPEELGLTER